MRSLLIRICLGPTLVGALAGGALSQDAARVTLHTGTTTLAQALNALAAKTGQSLDAIPRLRGEVVLLEIDDAPASDVLARLAVAVGAEWEKTANGYRLVLGAELERNQVAAMREVRAKTIQSALEERTKSMGDGRMDDATIKRLIADAQRVQEDLQRQMREGSRAGGSVFVNAVSSRPSPGATMPADRTMYRLLLAVGSAELAKIEPGERAVWSSNATQTQIRMPAQAQAALAEFVTDHNRIAQAVRDSGTPTGDPNQQFAVRMPGLVDLRSRPVQRLGKALLIVHREANQPFLFVQFRVTDEQGVEAATGNTVLSIEPPTDPVALKLKDPAAKVPAGALAKEFAELLRSANRTSGGSFQSEDGGMVRTVRVLSVGGEAMPFGESAEPANVTKEWAQRLANPETHDPLSFIAGEGLTRAIVGQGANLIACFPDSLIEYTARTFLTGEPTAASVLSLGGSNAVQVRQNDGWITISPRFPTEHRAMRVDRATLGQTLRRGIAQARLGLDDIANYARAQATPLAMEGIDGAYFSLLANSIADADTIKGLAPRREMLRFYANSGTPQRNALFAGQPLALGNLSGAQAQALHRMVFRAGFMSDLRFQGQGDGPIGGFMIEPTELLPTGVPRTGFLTCRVDEQASIVATNSKTGASRTLSADQLAMMLAKKEKPDLNLFGAPTGEYDLFRPSVNRRLRFTFQFSEAVALDQSLTDKAPPVGATRGVAYAQLPAGVLAMVEERKKMFLDGRFRGNVDVVQVAGAPVRRGGGTPPPR
ncbi:MAG: hypothetical protein KIS66_06810 [Fimbriimonadaceae bacterium]|nr:hypothetical protein [Fimbriimonadaceae bacterium]